jgi:hypothetical protein
MTDWIEHDGGPQPVHEDVWVEVDEGHIDYVCGPASEFEWDREEWFRWNIINQHLIDAARLEGIRLGLEAAAEVADHDWPDPNSPIRRLDPETIAREAKPTA